MSIKEITGGVCAPKGFKAAGVHCGLRKNRTKKDLALIVSETPCNAAGVYTSNLVKGAPVVVTKRNLLNHRAQAIICNSGNANTCNSDGIEIAEKMCRLVERVSGIKAEDVIVASTGVIGLKLNVEPIENSMGELYASLGDNSEDANEAIMTTDTVKKSVAVEFEVGGVKCRIGGIAKGVGMVCPNMATNLIFLTSDAAIAPDVLQKILSDDVKHSFNMISVDGDQSTNDTCCIMANGLAGNRVIDGSRAEDVSAFRRALRHCTVKLSKMLAKDGEGATKLIECNVRGAKSVKMAKNVAKSVVKSSLVKAAMFGSDANWGRVLCAIGYSGENIDPCAIDVDFKSKNGLLAVCRDGFGLDFDEDFAKKVLSADEIKINVNLKLGASKASAWGCDLTYDYVKINGDYRT